MGKFSEIEEEMKELRKVMMDNVRRMDSLIAKVDKIRTNFKYTPRERVEYLQDEINKLKNQMDK